MSTIEREQVARQLLLHPLSGREGKVQRAMKPGGTRLPGGRGGRYPRLHRLPSPTQRELEQREHGWNDRFFRDTPSQPKRPTNRDRPSDDANLAHELKEKRIRDERHQYGHAADAPLRPLKPKRPNKTHHPQLLPLARPPSVPQEPDLQSPRADKLRFKVLKAIDARETLIYQLNALILCTPIKESLLAASRPGEVPSNGQGSIRPKATMALAPPSTIPGGVNGVMSNSREATKLAQQLAGDLQMVGIQCVEAVVEWMLIAGAKAESPPQFLWRGRNYFTKMAHDLDFAESELKARGVELDCYSPANPLCVRPNQKLGRVLAAQAIINEMLAMGDGVVAQNNEMDEPTKPGRKKKNPAAASEPLEGVDPSTTDPNADASGIGADEMILQQNGDDSRTDHVATVQHSQSKLVREDGLPISTYSIVVASPSLLENVDADCELVDILDGQKNESNMSAVFEPPLASARNDNDTYDNSFEGDDEHDPTADIQQANNSLLPISPRIVVDEPDQTRHVGDDGQDGIRQVETQSKSHEGDEVDSSKQLMVLDAVPQLANKASEDCWSVLQTAFEEHATSQAAYPLKDCANWVSSSSLHDWLEKLSLSTVFQCFQKSFLNALCESGYLERPAELRALVESPTGTRIHLDGMLWAESVYVLDVVGAHIADRLRTQMHASNTLVSEIDKVELLEAAKAQVDALDLVADWVKRAFGVLICLWGCKRRGTPDLPPSRGLSQLVKEFYPFLLSDSFDCIAKNWEQIAFIFQSAWSVSFRSFGFLLDESCKQLLLNVEVLRKNAPTSGIEDSGHANTTIPKLTVVCDRDNVAQSTISSIRQACLESIIERGKNGLYQIFPFFQSGYGEKMVDGVRVEEGEGKGPLKEWFSLVTEDITSLWRRVPLDLPERSDFDVAVVSSNKLVADGLENILKPGYKVGWPQDDGDAAIHTRIINKCVASDTFLLDRAVTSQSFAASKLEIYEPRHAYLVYIQDSEAYWLNERTADQATERLVLRFLGWLMANALLHHCSLRIRLSALLLGLVLDATREITFDDIRGLDASLYAGMQHLKSMKPSEFAAYLEFEGLPASLSVEEYIQRTVNEKFGAASNIGWQIAELRIGFRRVYDDRVLSAVPLTERDLSQLLAGDDLGAGAEADSFAFDQIFRLSLDPDFVQCGPLQRGFWTAVEAFEPPLKRKLVKFITGVDTLPQAGTEFMRIEMPFPSITAEDHAKTLQMLPQSHTCDNTLELPHYWRALCWKAGLPPGEEHPQLQAALVAHLTDKLRTAAEYSGGYGLDGTTTAASSLGSGFRGSPADEGNSDNHQESFESLELPVMGEAGIVGLADDVATSVVDSGSGRTSPVSPSEDTPSAMTSPPALHADPHDDDAYDAEADWEDEEEVLA